jgi:hypothetical protein
MAKGSVVEREAEGASVDGATEVTTESKRKRESVAAKDMPKDARVQVGVTMPAGLKAIIDEEAEKRDVSVSSVVLKLVAEEFEYEITELPRGRAKSGLSDEERKKANAEKSKKMRDGMKKLLRLAAEGEVDLDELGLGDLADLLKK